MKRVPLSKMVYKRIRVWTSRPSLPILNFDECPTPPRTLQGGGRRREGQSRIPKLVGTRGNGKILLHYCGIF